MNSPAPNHWRVKYLRMADHTIGYDVLDAADAAAVDATLAGRGQIALSVKRRRAPFSALAWRRNARFSVPLFCEELRALLDAGLNLGEALDALRAQARDPTVAAVYQALVKRIHEGKQFSVALEESPHAFPRVLVAAIKGAEFTSGITSALARYLDYHRRLDELRSRAISASIYPGIVLALGAVIVLFLLGFVVPRFSQIYAEHAAASAGTAVILKLGLLIGGHWPMVLGALALSVAMVLHAAARPEARKAWLARLQDAPLLRDAFADLEFARVHGTLAMLVEGGFPVLKALSISRDAAMTPRTAQAIEQAAAAVESGKPIATAMRAVGLGDEISLRLVAAGENAGNLGAALAASAQHFSRRFERRVDRLTRLIEPLLLIAVGATIGLIVLLMYMPIFDLAGGLGN